MNTLTTIGLRVPDTFGTHDLSADELIARCATLGVDTVELSAAMVEAWLGAPPEPALLRMPEDDFEHGLLPIEEEVFRDEIELGRATFAAQLRQWRLSVLLTRSSSALDHLRGRFAAAGIRIAILEWDGLASLPDEEVDYAFEIAKRLGAVALSTDLSSGGPKHLGAFAAKHQTMIGFHGDEGTGSEALEAALAPGAFNGISVDVTSWVVGGNGSPLPFIERHASRVTHVQLRDRRTNEGGPSLSSASILEMLEAIHDRDWTFPAIVAFESDLADGPDRMAAIAAYLNGLRLIT